MCVRVRLHSNTILVRLDFCYYLLKKLYAFSYIFNNETSSHLQLLMLLFYGIIYSSDMHFQDSNKRLLYFINSCSLVHINVATVRLKKKQLCNIQSFSTYSMSFTSQNWILKFMAVFVEIKVL